MFAYEKIEQRNLIIHTLLAPLLHRIYTIIITTTATLNKWPLKKLALTISAIEQWFCHSILFGLLWLIVFVIVFSLPLSLTHTCTFSFTCSHSPSFFAPVWFLLAFCCCCCFLGLFQFLLDMVSSMSYLYAGIYFAFFDWYLSVCVVYV